jgi:MFS transporter, AAHS family, 4-hydroxybenzoate transporter
MSSSSKLDINEELGSASVSSSHIMLAITITLITLFDGYDTFNPAYVMHYVSLPWGLAPSQAGLLISSGLIGFLFGAVVQGAAADRFGRRSTLLWGLWIVNIFTALTALLAVGFWSFCTLRFATGLGLGVLLPLGTTYVNELAPKHTSNAFSLLGVALGWSLGGILASLIGVFLTPLYGWRVLYFIGAFSIPLTFVVHLILPESPMFLALHDRTVELRKIMSRLRPDRSAIYQTAEFRKPLAKSEGHAFPRLLSSRYRRTSVTIWITAFLSLFTLFGLTGWIPTVMIQRGETFAASFGFGAILQAASFAGGLLLANIADRQTIPIPYLLGIWWFMGGLSVLSLDWLDGHSFNLLFVGLAGFFVIGAQFVLNNFTAGSYETDVRASGVGLELGIGRIGAVLGPYVVGLLQQLTAGTQAVFWAVGGAAIVAGISIASLGMSFVGQTTASRVAGTE